MTQTKEAPTSPDPAPPARLDRPAGRAVTVGLAALLLAAPAWVMADPLPRFTLFGDDFIFIALARETPTLLDTLLEPHNTHVVPLFRLWTYLIAGLSGSLERMPVVFGAAAYLALVTLMLV